MRVAKTEQLILPFIHTFLFFFSFERVERREWAKAILFFEAGNKSRFLENVRQIWLLASD
jgi:hypothetical protein